MMGKSLRELWKFRELFYFMVWRDVKVRYKQSVLGAGWAIVQPLTTMLIFTLFFHRLGGIKSPDLPYPIFSYSGMLLWIYFSGSVTSAGTSLVANSDLLTKVYFPRAIIPAAAAIRGLVDFAIATLVLFGLMLWYRCPPSWPMLLWPVLMIPLLIFVLAIGMICSALEVKYRDVKHALPFVIQVWLFLTPVIYPAEMIPERFRVFIALNPLSGIIEAFRASMTSIHRVNWHMLGISSAVILLIFAIAITYFRAAERTFADVV